MTALPVPVESFLERKPALRAPVRFVWRVVERWETGNGSLLAAALAFYGLLSLFPLALAGVILLARVASNNAGALNAFSHFVGSFFPASTGIGVASSIQEGVQKLSAGPSPLTATVVAVVSLIWSGRAYFDTLAAVLNQIYSADRPRSYLGHQLTMLALMMGTGLLFVASSAATFALSVLQSWAEHAPQLFLNRAPLLFDIMGKLVAWGLTLVMFWLLYRFAPNRQHAPPRRAVVGGALFSAVAFEIAKWAFARFLGNVTRYEATYGSVAGVVLTMMWLYFASMIVLIGAQIGATWEEFRRERLKAENQ
ncbi:YihY/virulence factor BrkB family protein [bacterium]|nr:MAG: YihY/virulence factor BrkB family protein [bacterium]